MAYTFDTDSAVITLPRGDTADIPVTVTGLDVADGDAVVFGLWNITKKRWAFKRHAIIADGVANIRIASADTRSLPLYDEYGWSMTVVTNPDISADGVVVAVDNSDNVYTMYESFRPFKLAEGGVMGE